MAVTINHGYAPVQSDHYTEYDYDVTVDSTTAVQIGAPAYYDGIMRFSGFDICFNRADVTYSLTDCSFTDTSNNARRYWSEFDTAYNMYILRYQINSDPSTIIEASNYPIYFGWYAAGGGYWIDGVTPGFRADIVGRASTGREFGGGEVRVETRVTLSQDNRLYDVAETMTATPTP
jgi:hypothetical protein